MTRFEKIARYMLGSEALASKRINFLMAAAILVLVVLMSLLQAVVNLGNLLELELPAVLLHDVYLIWADYFALVMLLLVGLGFFVRWVMKPKGLVQSIAAETFLFFNGLLFSTDIILRGVFIFGKEAAPADSLPAANAVSTFFELMRLASREKASIEIVCILVFTTALIGLLTTVLLPKKS